MRWIGESFVQIYTSYIFEILEVTNPVTRRLYFPGAVAHMAIPMHLSLTNYNTSSTILLRAQQPRSRHTWSRNVQIPEWYFFWLWPSGFLRNRWVWWNLLLTKYGDWVDGKHCMPEMSLSQLLTFPGSRLKLLHWTVPKSALWLRSLETQERGDHIHHSKSLLRHLLLELIFSKSTK